MKSIKMSNIKKPTYSTEIGKGCFAAGVYSWWICQKCGKKQQYMSSDGNTPPDPRHGGVRCPESASGNHVWAKA